MKTWNTRKGEEKEYVRKRGEVKKKNSIPVRKGGGEVKKNSIPGSYSQERFSKFDDRAETDT